MDKHTPGPWRVSDENPKIVIEDRLPFYSEGRIVAKVSGYPDSGFFFSDEEAADHARLIAAAPELLEALDLVKSHLGEPGCAIWRHVHSVIDAALAKARGDAVRDPDDFVECQACYGKGFNDVERQVAERKSDVQTFRETCDACEGTGKVSAGGAA